MKLLHLGCGNIRLAEYINIDIRKTNATDLVLDLNSPDTDFPTNVDGIFSNAFFEHLFYSKRIGHLASVKKVLNDNGFLCYIGIPYFKNIAKCYLEGSVGVIGDKFNLYEVYRYTHGDPENAENYLAQLHKALFDEDEIVFCLESAGFYNYLIFSYAYPTDKHSLLVTMGFYATNKSINKNDLQKEFYNYIKQFDSRFLILNSLTLIKVRFTA